MEEACLLLERYIHFKADEQEKVSFNSKLVNSPGLSVMRKMFKMRQDFQRQNVSTSKSQYQNISALKCLRTI